MTDLLALGDGFDGAKPEEFRLGDFEAILSLILLRKQQHQISSLSLLMRLDGSK